MESFGIFVVAGRSHWTIFSHPGTLCLCYSAHFFTDVTLIVAETKSKLGQQT